MSTEQTGTPARATGWPASAIVAIAPGRRLRWSPEWDCSDDTVLFDAASGDFWVLSADARALVQQLEREGPLPRHAWPTDGPAGDMIEHVLASLVRGGVLRACENGQALSPPRADDLD